MPKPTEENVLPLQILSAFVQKPELFVSYADKLSATFFGDGPFAGIYDAMLHYNKHVGLFDAEMLRSRLNDMQQPEQLVWLETMQTEPVLLLNIHNLIADLRENHARLLLLNLGNLLVKESFGKTYLPKDLHQLVTNKLVAIGETVVKGELINLQSLLKLAVAQQSLVEQNQITWFDDELQDMLTGIFAGELIVVGARPGIGKTSFIHTQLIHTAVQQKQPVGYINFEENERSLAAKLMHTAKGNTYKNNTDCFNVEQLKNIPVYLATQMPTNDIKQVKFMVNMLTAKYDTKLVVIDCFHNISYRAKYNNRDYEMGKVLLELKQLAKQLQIAIIVTSQLSRMAEKRGSLGRPMLSDLKDTGHLEEVPDKILLLYRDAYYGITMDEDGYDTAGVTEVIIAKNKEGKTGKVFLYYDEQTLKYTNEKIDKKEFIFPDHRLDELV